MKHLNCSLSKVAASLVFLGVALLALPAVAQTNNGDNGGGALVPKAAGAAQSTQARLTALVAPGGVLIRSKGVASVTNPSTGITCIKPSSALVNIGRIVPAVTVEWGWSFGNNLVAYYFSNEPSFFTDCPARNIEVRTYNFAGNLSSAVAFTIVVD